MDTATEALRTRISTLEGFRSTIDLLKIQANLNVGKALQDVQQAIEAARAAHQRVSTLRGQLQPIPGQVRGLVQPYLWSAEAIALIGQADALPPGLLETGPIDWTLALQTDGGNNGVVSVQTEDPGLEHLAAVLFRDGTRLPQAPAVWLNDKGQNGDERAGDGIFTSNGLRLGFAKVAPGPLTLRLIAANRTGHTLVVEVEGLQAQAP